MNVFVDNELFDYLFLLVGEAGSERRFIAV